jgi:hypothetical protein
LCAATILEEFNQQTINNKLHFNISDQSSLRNVHVSLGISHHSLGRRECKIRKFFIFLKKEQNFHFLQNFYIKLLAQPRCNFHRNWNFVWPTRRDLSFKRIHISLGISYSLGSAKPLHIYKYTPITNHMNFG